MKFIKISCEITGAVNECKMQLEIGFQTNVVQYEERKESAFVSKRGNPNQYI